MNNQQPSALKIVLDLTLDTKEATNLFYGRKKIANHNVIIGLEMFAHRVKSINNAARNDDPYADYFLLEIEEALSVANNSLDEIEQDLDTLTDTSLLKVDKGSSNTPIKLKTNYSAVYANLALELLKKSDRIFYKIHILAHLGIYTRAEKNTKIASIKTLMRRTFLSQQGYRFLAINRKDIELMTARGSEAKVAMRFTEDLDPKIVSKERRAKHAPNIIDPNEIFKATQKPTENENKDKK